MLVSQSYNIFNRYGKDTDALKDITRAFIEDLREFSADQITGGFKAWRKRKDGMPTPANIIDEINHSKQSLQSGLKKFSAWDGSWEGYLEYLDKNNALSPNFVRINGRFQLRPGYVPEWTMKDFK